MKKLILSFFLIFSFAITTGCDSLSDLKNDTANMGFNESLTKIKKGMTPEKVKKVIGEPESVSKEEEDGKTVITWKYPAENVYDNDKLKGKYALLKFVGGTLEDIKLK